MEKATDVIISGSSAGGLAVMILLDQIGYFTYNDKLLLLNDFTPAALITARSALEKPPRIAGVADAGFFLDMPSFEGVQGMRDKLGFARLFEFQNSQISVSAECKLDFPSDGDEVNTKLIYL